MLQTADADTQRIADNPRAGDETLIVRFHLADVEDIAASKAAGYPVFRQVEGLTVKAPGSLDSNFVDLSKENVRAYWARRFPRHYAAFKAGVAEPEDGLPVAEWPPARRADVELLKFNGIRTVEQLAGVSDAHIGALGNGARVLRQKAKDWLERARSAAPTAKLAAENADLRASMEILQRAVETLQKQQGISPQPIVEVAPSAAAPQAAKSPRKRKPNQESQS